VGTASHADSQAKVAQVNVEAGVYHNVFGLDIPVDNPAVMASFDSREQLFEYEVSLVLSQVPWLLGHHEFVEVATRDVGRHHHDLVLSDDSF